MTHALTIARRDLAERSSVFIAAVAMAVLPFILVLVPGMQTFKRTDVLTTAGSLLSLGFSLGLALLLGATMIGRDLSEKRMSFYFSKPLSGPAIWFGKLIAALITVAGCFAIIFFPSYLSSPVSWQNSWNVDLPIAFSLIGITTLVLLLLGHVLGTMFRSKSPLLALDLAALVAAGFAFVGIVRPLLVGYAVELTRNVSLALFGATIVVLILGGAWQLAKGRADRRQNHVELSRFLWISLAIVLAIGGAYSAWVVHVGPGDLVKGDVVQAEQGSWGFLFGRANHRMDYHALFAYDLASGEGVRVDGVQSWFSSGLSRDGRRMAYLKLEDYTAGVGELYVMPLSSGAKAEATRISATRSSAYTFSDDSSRLAVMEPDGIVTAYDVASNRALVSAKLPAAAHNSRRCFFATPDLLRVYVTAPQFGSVKPEEHTLDIYELDVRTRGLQHTGSYRSVTKSLQMTVSSDGNRGLLFDGDHAFIIDARTAQVIAPVPAGNLMHTTLLADGSVAKLAANDAHDWTLTMHKPDGSEQQIAIGRMKQLHFARELRGGLLVLTGADQSERSTYVVDYAHGSVVRREPDLRAASYSWMQWNNTDPRRAIADPQQPIAAYDKANALYAWQPLTGAKKELLRF